MFYKFRDHIVPMQACVLVFYTYQTPSDREEIEYKESYFVKLIMLHDKKQGFSLKLVSAADLRSAKASIMGKIAAGKQLVDIDDIVATWCNKAEVADDGREG